ncbi:SPRY domain-containing SOCS box protein 3-like isoform X1, partial [Vespula squamosa]
REWSWDTDYTSDILQLSKNNLEIDFVSTINYYITVARGNKPLKLGKHHYWELKIIARVNTIITIGVCTEKLKPEYQDRFHPIYKNKTHYWGYSSTGYLTHGTKVRQYTACFNKGSVIGVHLDTWRGTLQFFSKKKPLGIAFTGLKNTVLYPMVRVSNGHCKIRILYCCSIPVSLQTECLSVLPLIQRNFLSNNYPILRYLTQSTFADILRKNAETESDEGEFEFAPEYRRTVKVL